MSEKYRFLRFESAGMSTTFYIFLMILPVYWEVIKKTFQSDISGVLGSIATLLLISLPLGYIEHQLVVNRYRSEKNDRLMHTILNNEFNSIIEKNQKTKTRDIYNDLDAKLKSSFLTSFLDLLTYQKKINTKSDLHDRISSLWSHLYGRKAVGIYAPILSLLFYLLICGIKYYKIINININLNNFYIGLGIGIFILLIGLIFINPYSKIIWYELNYLEAQFIIIEKEKVHELIISIINELEDNGEIMNIKKGKIWI